MTMMVTMMTTTDGNNCNIDGACGDDDGSDCDADDYFCGQPLIL